MKILIVEDNQERLDGFAKKFLDDKNEVWFCTTYDTAVNVLRDNQIDALYLDHDLGEGKTGYDLACWLEEQEYLGNLPIPRLIYIHSENTVGAANIQRVFPQAIRCPGCWQSPTDTRPED